MFRCHLLNLSCFPSCTDVTVPLIVEAASAAGDIPTAAVASPLLTDPAAPAGVIAKCTAPAAFDVTAWLTAVDARLARFAAPIRDGLYVDSIENLVPVLSLFFQLQTLEQNTCSICDDVIE
jgi:hypothetical protein